MRKQRSHTWFNKETNQPHNPSSVTDLTGSDVLLLMKTDNHLCMRMQTDRQTVKTNKQTHRHSHCSVLWSHALGHTLLSALGADFLV